MEVEVAIDLAVVRARYIFSRLTFLANREQFCSSRRLRVLQAVIDIR